MIKMTFSALKLQLNKSKRKISSCTLERDPLVRSPDPKILKPTSGYNCSLQNIDDICNSFDLISNLISSFRNDSVVSFFFKTRLEMPIQKQSRNIELWQFFILYPVIVFDIFFPILFSILFFVLIFKKYKISNLEPFEWYYTPIITLFKRFPQQRIQNCTLIMLRTDLRRYV